MLVIKWEMYKVIVNADPDFYSKTMEGRYRVALLAGSCFMYVDVLQIFVIEK